MKEHILERKPVIAGVIWKEDEKTSCIIIRLDEKRKSILSKIESHVWKCIDGEKTVGEIISKIGGDKREKVIEAFNTFESNRLIRYKTLCVWIEED